MSITNELRRYAANWDGWFYSEDGGLINAFGHVPAQSTPVPKVINAIADCIDEQYDRTCMALDSAWSATSHAVLEQAIDELSDEYVKLPVDADGVPIRIGDELDVGFVARIVITDDEWTPYLYAYKETPNILSQHFCNEVSHHHEPTVEDVLREFFSRYVTTKPKDEDDAILAEYAAKLRLAGDAE